MADRKDDRTLESLAWAKPYLKYRLAVGEEGVSIDRSVLGISAFNKHDKIPFDRLKSFDIQMRRWFGYALVVTKDPTFEYRLGPFSRTQLLAFDEEMRTNILANKPNLEFQMNRMELHKITDEVARLAGGSDQEMCDMVDLLLAQGIHHRCSDIHLDPREEDTIIRYRSDGMFREIASIPKVYEAQIVARMKVLAGLVSYETRVPQEGRISIPVGGRDIDLRVSVYPTLQGEKVAIRVFDSEGSQFELAALGHNLAEVDQLRALLGKPSGTILLTGPSGSGKTTTIYAVLREIQKIHGQLTNIVTIEDPIEHRLPGIQQTEIFEPKGLTFLAGLRAMLRQNAEVIMVGEIRDSETSSVSIQAGLTGHLVISTIHAGTSAGVLARLVEMGIEPFLIVSSITAILAQRLPRKNCQNCLERYTPSPEVLMDVRELLPERVEFSAGTGCDECHGIGYIGRTPVSELLVLDETLEKAILNRASVRELELAACRNGMRTMWENGLAKVAQGILSPDELVRVVPRPISESRELAPLETV